MKFVSASNWQVFKEIFFLRTLIANLINQSKAFSSSHWRSLVMISFMVLTIYQHKD